MGRRWIMKVFECLGEDSIYPTRLLQIWQAPQVISLCPVGYVLDWPEASIPSYGKTQIIFLSNPKIIAYRPLPSKILQSEMELK